MTGSALGNLRCMSHAPTSSGPEEPAQLNDVDRSPAETSQLLVSCRDLLCNNAEDIHVLAILQEEFHSVCMRSD